MAFNLQFDFKTIKPCLKVVENRKVVDLNKKEYSKRSDAVSLPAKVYRELMHNLEAIKTQSNKSPSGKSPSSKNPEKEKESMIKIEKYRLAFFEVIIDLFLNYKKHISSDANQMIQFNARAFSLESDPQFLDFYTKFFQLDLKDKQDTNNHSQMFSQFITIQHSPNSASLTDQERIMCEHIQSAIAKVDQKDKNSEMQSCQALNWLASGT